MLRSMRSVSLAVTTMLLTGCAPMAGMQGGNVWKMGFGSAVIIPDDIQSNPLYISGYNQGWLVNSYLDNNRLNVYKDIREGWGETEAPDYAQTRAVYLDAGPGGVLLIGVDCVALSTHHVEIIRGKLADAAKKANCSSINVYATHSHALPDTLGLWGPVGVDGKDAAYMEKLVDAAVSAGTQALSTVHEGKLYYGKTDAGDTLYDSRDPQVFDPDLHQLRFESSDGFAVRMFFFGAHAESLRGANKLLSRDFPGVLCDLVTAETGDHTMFLPGAIGGLLMTKEYTDIASSNLQITGRKLADIALSIEQERELKPEMSIVRAEFSCSLDNNVFLYYQSLGILNCRAETGTGATGYNVRSEMSLLRLGDLHIALIPGEIFPELVYGGSYGSASAENTNPVPLLEILRQFGSEELLIIGLANDELGYIIPPSDFLVNPEKPYLDKIVDSTGENHYEETNSVGPAMAGCISDTFRLLLVTMYQK